MAGSEVLPLTRNRLDATALTGALKLSGEAGWNQTADDWRVFLRHGEVNGFSTEDGELVATAALLPYGMAQAWISMVLVTPAWRHRGLATALLNHGVERLQRSGHVPVLDATPAGAAVYRQLGFREGFGFERWQASLPAGRGAPAAAGVRPATEQDWGAITAADAAGSGIARGFLLRDFLARAGTLAWTTQAGDGFVIVREGQRALQLGPLVAPDEAAALALLQTALGAVSGPLFLDLPLRWPALRAALRLQGFVQQRPFVRMALADSAALPGSERLFVVAGPEFG